MAEETFHQVKNAKKGMNVTAFLLVKNMNVKTSSNNKMYGDYTLADATGEINGKLWDVADPKECPQIGDIIKVRGLVTEWQGNLQLRMDKFRPLEENDPVTPRDIIPSAPESPEDMLQTIKEYVQRIKNNDIRTITVRFLKDYAEPIKLHPAALKNHHSIRSGLLYHTTTMLKLADGILNVYDHLDADLVFAGVILHDICKIDEINAGEAGMPTDYTREGLLLGHIAQGVAAIGRVGLELGIDNEILVMLQHMILAHHYEPEYGSPRRPMFPEAEILHYLDMIDTRMYDMKKVMGELGDGEFSQSIWTLHNRKIYKKTF